ncbi:lysozyme isoform X2 [Drosophila grimshawi]|uniref:lysozyme n=1 Tax=Drosophila grimshawi TaxID=7222 RepID=B4JN62_DROGR|nr:lysozyme isoform X2 [Drosophila grimshawi]EDV92155.1 GH24755 [Drosophila grimshawi]EDW04474.1 GH23420 [Drosophila grimshawi]
MRSTSIALLLVVGLWFSSSTVLGKRYMRCELARKLLEQHSFERSLLSNWICLLEHESELDTAKMTTNPNGSHNYGLFQINTRFCQENRRGGVCNIKCAELLDVNLREAASCAKYIQATEGFRHWNGWQRYCRNPQNLPNLKVICGI